MEHLSTKLQLGVSVLLIGLLFFRCNEKTSNLLKPKEDWQIDTVKWHMYQSNFNRNFYSKKDKNKGNVFSFDILLDNSGKDRWSVPTNKGFYCQFTIDSIIFEPKKWQEDYLVGFDIDTITRIIHHRCFNEAVVQVDTITHELDSGFHFHPSLFDTTKFKPQFYYERDAFICYLKQNQSKMNKKSWLYQEAVRRGIFKE